MTMLSINWWFLLKRKSLSKHLSSTKSTLSPILYLERVLDAFSSFMDLQELVHLLYVYFKFILGKTLTAGRFSSSNFYTKTSIEAIAELLHRPLYSVTVGELGTDPVQLESKLREILEVASVWKSDTFNFPSINSHRCNTDRWSRYFLGKKNKEWYYEKCKPINKLKCH